MIIQDLTVALVISMATNFLQIALTCYFIFSKVLNIERILKKNKE